MTGREAWTEAPAGATFVDGIGPPLEQIEQDYRALLDSTCAGMAEDVLALIAEINRLRGVLDRISRQTHREATSWGSFPAQIARGALASSQGQEPS